MKIGSLPIFFRLSLSGQTGVLLFFSIFSKFVIIRLVTVFSANQMSAKLENIDIQHEVLSCKNLK
jgi:hypothetical protein